MAARSRRRPWAAAPTVLTAVFAVLLVVAGQGPAAAGWHAGGGVTASARATTVPQGDGLTATKSTAMMTPRLFSLQWNTSYVGGRAATAYRIQRSTGGAASTMTETTCNGGSVDEHSGVFVPGSTGATTHSCTDTVPQTLFGATYTWTVQPIYRTWLGTPSVGAAGTA